MSQDAPPPRRRLWRRLGLALLLLLVLVPAGLWLQRKPIAGDVLDRELARRGVQASYRITRLGFRTERLEDVVIGDPRDPDLTAEWAEVLVTTRWSFRHPTRPGVTVRKITARGVRLNARIVGGRVRMGQIDKLLPPPTGKPFAFPDFEVDLDRTSIRLATPAGAVGLALQGRGKLSDGFRGQLAASAPRLASNGPCVGTAVRARLAVAIDKRSPHVTGPVQAALVDCPDSDVSAVRLKLVVDARVPERFDRWTGSARLAMDGLEVARGLLGDIEGNARFAGNADVTLGSLDILAARARFADHSGRRLRFDGRYRAQPRAGRFALLGDAALDDLALSPEVRASLLKPLAAVRSTPVAPLGKAAASALGRAMRTIDLSGRLRLVHGPGGGGARMETMRAASGSGARLALEGGEGLTYYWPDRRFHIDGEAALSSGELPTARLAFDQPRPGAPVDGLLHVAPYAAGDTRLALAPVRFTSLPGGATRVQTVVSLDGAYQGTRVAGLVVPVDARVGTGGRFAVNPVCVTARWTRLQYQGLDLGPTALPLCPSGAALVSRNGGAVTGGAALASPRFAGLFNGRPFATSASRATVSLDRRTVLADALRVKWGAIGATAARFDARLNQRRFDANTVAFRIGEEPSQTRFDTDALSGGWQGSDFAGTFGPGRGQVGQVPLLMSNAAGSWSYRRGVLAADGALTVADAAANPRFFPLRAEAARLTLADNRIAAAAVLTDPETGTKVSGVTIAHDLRDGTGKAVLDVPGIRFGPRFQPEALTRLTTGVVALVNGVVRGRGDVRWNRAGVTSGGRFSTGGLDLAAAFGPVSGIKGELVFNDLLGLATAPGQSISIAEINPGILVQNGTLKYQLLPGQRVRIEGARWPYAGGELILEETILELGRPAPKKLTFRVVGMDAALFVQQFEFENISATGTFDGVIPMVFDESGGRIVGGSLTSRPGGGTLAYVGVLSDKALGTYGKLAFDALKSLRYTEMNVYLDGDLDGEFLSRFTVTGRNQAEKATGILRQITGLPFKFNIAIRGQFRALLATARSFNDPRDLIKRSLPLPVEGVPGSGPTIQPPASEKSR